MNSCPACSTENPDDGKFCRECGAALGAPYAATVTADAVAGSISADASKSSDTSCHGRFVPGTKIADRYRIVSLAGRGGMGEVYRADDLKLGHTVALKFLPRDLAEDPRRLEYFHSEVRLTRQISHPNVCRVYDIGEYDGQHFLSMEFVDGEDLRVLLRRIGRLPGDKGVEIAQQLCGGLNAAHTRGVLHRDLKPANVMLDGRGQVRITDFGLARVAGDEAGRETAGTPAYMAPEQLTLGQTTVQSDLYSLGLILHELFTGRAVHPTGSLPDLLEYHQRSSIPEPSALVEDLDPVVERAIVRCLHPEAARRPKSVRSVAAALPGGDPLQAALDAGETPSPELVAAAGDNTQVNPRLAVAALAGTAICLIANVYLADRVTSIGESSLKYEPAVLRNKIRDMLTEDFGYEVADYDSIDGFSVFPELSDRTFVFWYRDRVAGTEFSNSTFWTDVKLRPRHSRARPDPFWPPLDSPGERAVVVSGDGRLLSFRAVPPFEVITDRTVTPPRWSDWFQETTGFYLPIDHDDRPSQQEIGSDTLLLEIVSDRWRPPPDAFDVTGLWRGVNETDGSTFYVEAAAYQGKPTWFSVIREEEFNAPVRFDFTEQPDYRTETAVVVTLLVILMGVGILLAWLNLRHGRGDRVGAKRLAGYVLGLEIAALLLHARHMSFIQAEYGNMTMGLAQALVGAARIWIWYLALEPFVRRVWPRILVTSSRLLDGRPRDPLVGRDLLAGVLCALVSNLVLRLSFWIQNWAQMESRRSELDVLTLVGARESLGSVLSSHAFGIFLALFVVMVLLAARIVLKNERRASVAFVLVWSAALTMWIGGHPALTFPAVVVRICLVLFLLVRFGVLALIVDMTVIGLSIDFPITSDSSQWYFRHGLLAVVLIAAIAIYGFVTAVRRSKIGPVAVE